MHYIVYLIKNYKYILVLIISIIWEIFEYLISYNKKLNILTKKYWFVPERYWNEKKNNKIFDIMINFLGYYVGSLSHNII